MPRNYYKHGTWNAICEVCGGKFKNEELLLRWDNKMVCRKDYEVRHSLDFLRTSQRELSVPWTRPEAGDSFISVSYNPVFGFGYLLQEDGSDLLTEYEIPIQLESA